MRLPDILVAQSALPVSIESQMPNLPKISGTLMNFARSLPAGPDIPLPAALSTPLTVPTLPQFVGPEVLPVAMRLPKMQLPTEYMTTPSPIGQVTQEIKEKRGF